MASRFRYLGNIYEFIAICINPIGTIGTRYYCHQQAVWALSLCACVCVSNILFSISSHGSDSDKLIETTIFFSLLKKAKNLYWIMLWILCNPWVGFLPWNISIVFRLMVVWLVFSIIRCVNFSLHTFCGLYEGDRQWRSRTGSRPMGNKKAGWDRGDRVIE